MALRVFAFGCHPDDIEILMSGTLFLLREAGAKIHYMNLATGNLGTDQHDREEIVRIRRQEGINAANFLGAEFHESIVDDLEVLYDVTLLRKIAAIVREVRPDIMLLLSPDDYMEDHMNAARLGYTAAFSRGMRNFGTIPERPPYFGDVALYHALPYSLCDMMNEPVHPHFYVDVATVLGEMQSMLARHESQKTWLDRSQGLDSYIAAMTERAATVGQMSGEFRYAEGWRKHNHIGFCRQGSRPLEDVLRGRITERNERGTSRESSS